MTALDDTLSHSDRASALQEADARIREHGVRHVYLQYVSVPGRVVTSVCVT